ncbi:hypothetical protein Gogos_001142, partial [Gossypium gossypioides]|nr:hypothetical protein [Gossypium gossypioides]
MSFFFKTSKRRLQILTCQTRIPTWLLVSFYSYLGTFSYHTA